MTLMAMLRRGRAFRGMISSEGYCRKLRRLLRFVGEPTLTPTLAALARELSEESELRKQESADEIPRPTFPLTATHWFSPPVLVKTERPGIIHHVNNAETAGEELTKWTKRGPW
ncbi:hypothetical protein [Mesorhizobium sp. M0898]|uniref:hypothetical protein n=1 Tax=Mesorhizobium sp. M0898 TaxID=2957020 RepID=UPI00333DA877